MKKLIGLICAIMFSAILSGCANSNDDIPLIINASDNIENRNEIIAQVYHDLKPLHKSDVPVKVINLHIDDCNDELVANATDVYCKAEDILSGDYLEPLVLKYIDIDYKDLWKRYAIYGYLYKEEIDSETVIEFLKDDENRDILSMFIGYFIPEYKTQEEIKMDADVAKLYGQFIVKKYGIGELLCCEAGDHVNEWLESLGLSFQYVDEYAELLNTFEYSEEYNYNLVVYTDQNIRFYMSPAVDDNSVYSSRQFLYEAYEAVENILIWVGENAPDYYDKVMARLTSKTVRVYFDRTIRMLEGGVTDWNSSEIRMIYYGVFSHEFCHILFAEYNSSAHRWVYEGIAEYGAIYLNEHSIVTYNYKDDMESRFKYRDLYDEVDPGFMKKLDELESAQVFSSKEYFIALSKLAVKLRLMGEKVGSVYDFYGADGATIPKEENIELTYNEAMCFVDYLINEYSLSSLLKYVMDKSTFEEAFGVTFDDALHTWQQEFVKEY